MKLNGVAVLLFLSTIPLVSQIHHASAEFGSVSVPVPVAVPAISPLRLSSSVSGINSQSSEAASDSSRRFRSRRFPPPPPKPKKRKPKRRRRNPTPQHPHSALTRKKRKMRTINAGKRLGLLFVGIASLLQVAIFVYLVLKRKQLMQLARNSGSGSDNGGA